MHVPHSSPESRLTGPTFELLLAFALALPLAAQNRETALRQALLFYASFDTGIDADHAAGDKRLFTAPSYKEKDAAKPGLHHPDVSIAAGKGRFGDALEFRRKNTRAVFYSADRNANYRDGVLEGTVSFWLNLDPERDLEPGFCDPIQITDKAYNDSAIWVDFTRDERPRHFRLGVFGALKSWNPDNLPPEKNPDFERRLVVLAKHPFQRGKWTHVAVTFAQLGAGNGRAALFVDGAHVGTREGIAEPFHWDHQRAAIRLGVNYVGLFDELALFNRPLSEAEIRALRGMSHGFR
jgi:hypothetical protein